ncbi:hypothetical protein [Filomicrobium sp.]|uniref:hypothetical protein n=1 Tax=Filomicrobium sp. TaxID=2024831 RepID=UPI00258422EE|nr:hypothetical protein [Filomicrobium sp.]MCV0371750.1 helix-turn-helix domain-containing protein [Filomicrobium sp.]
MNDAERLASILGSQIRAARVLGVTPEHVSRMVKGRKDVPEYVTVIADLLEQTPRGQWPASVTARLD